MAIGCAFALHEYPNDSSQRAIDLLISHLNEAQRTTLAEYLAFDVVARSGNTYRIYATSRGPVDLMDRRGQIIGRFCIYAPAGYPTADEALTKKLLIEADERKFWATGFYDGAWVPPGFMRRS
jgi:hypothetical protein